MGGRNGDAAIDVQELTNLLGDFISAYLEKLQTSREQVLHCSTSHCSSHTALPLHCSSSVALALYICEVLLLTGCTDLIT